MPKATQRIVFVVDLEEYIAIHAKAHRLTGGNVSALLRLGIDCLGIQDEANQTLARQEAKIKAS